ncbi:uncharacterized protein AB9X84_020238 isoform 1-T2 [Acanthopagrus schlegelii]
MINPWLRRSYIVFNISLPIVGGLFLAGLYQSLDDFSRGNDVRQKTPSDTGDALSQLSVSQFDRQRTEPIILYVVGSVTMLIASLGIYGALKENLVALAVNLIGILLMIGAAVLVVFARPQSESRMEERWLSFLPLDQASDAVKNKAEALQTSLHCCGLLSYEDWQQNIPDSCLCNQEEKEEEGKCQTIDYGNFLLNLVREKKSVFRQNCFPLMLDSATTDANIKLCSVITLLLLTLLGLVLSSLIIYQMFINRPPGYQRLHNLLAYETETKP